MKFNEVTEEKLRKLFGLEIPTDREKVKVVFRQASNRMGLFQLMNQTIKPKVGANIYELEPLNGKKGVGITGLKTQLQLDPTADAPTNEAQENGKDESGKYCLFDFGEILKIIYFGIFPLKMGFSLDKSYASFLRLR